MNQIFKFQNKIPVTIITGFLGSGKTTLLNHILTNRDNLKIAVLVNEFGEINIDSQLLVSIDRDMMLLSNGCICCTINAGLIDAVNQVLERKNIDYIVIETTGLAEPIPLMMTFTSSSLRDTTRLDSILTVVDAENFNPEKFESKIALEQVIYGDIIILNKIDLVSQTKIKEIEEFINSVKLQAKIIRSEYGKVSLPFILDVGNSHFKTLSSSSLQHKIDSFGINKLAEENFMSVAFQSNRPLIIEKFSKFLDEQLPKTVFRGKGIIWYQGSKLRHIFQLSGKRCNFQRDEWTTLPCNQLVFIGQNLDAVKIKSQLEECLDII
ncbi:MAG: GTP-binding protein [Richelia sp. RM2_1_2]|nr:GTP-binding protein [Richelia sp. RM1_1_1]NJO29843.1 GTP-binding protein [Richelia sp. SL_2_1]NJO62113.1 GTP-binding protein [Richelia sp. RM2_1_2]